MQGQIYHVRAYMIVGLHGRDKSVPITILNVERECTLSCLHC